MRNEDNGTATGQIDSAWNSQDPIWCHERCPQTHWFCSLSPGHTSPYHVAHGGSGRVLSRWPADHLDLKVASGL